MNIEELTIGQAREIAALVGGASAAAKSIDPGPWLVGKNYFIRTVTHHLTGKLVAVGAQELSLTDAAWIADDGRFAQAVESEDFNEVEPFPAGRTVIIGRGSVIDAVEITTTPRSQK